MIRIPVAPGGTLVARNAHIDVTVDAPPAQVARLLRQLADDLDRQAAR